MLSTPYIQNMRKVKIAFAQIYYKPAVILDSHNLLVEPLYSSFREKHTSISLMEFRGAPRISSELLEDYLSWLRAKIKAIIEKSIKLNVDLLVFPEYSIPAELLNDVCNMTKNTNICIVAGTHMVTENVTKLPEGYPEIKNYKRCAMVPIIQDGKIRHYSFKKFLASAERNDIKIPKEPVSDVFDMGDYTLTIKVCIEALVDTETVADCDKNILVIPSLSHNIEPFRALQILAKYKEIPVIYVNIANYGGSVISGPYATEGKHWFVEGVNSSPIPKGCEALVTATLDVDAMRYSVGTALLPRAIELNEVLPLLYREKEADNELMEQIKHCIKNQSVCELSSHVHAKESIIGTVIKRLQHDEQQGILDEDSLSTCLDYVKINTCDYQQMINNQVCKAEEMLIKRAELGLSDEHYSMSLECLISYVNSTKKAMGTNEPDFSNDKGLFRGRDPEKNTLSQFFDSNSEKLLFINGLRGIGKTKLISSIENEILPPDSMWNIRIIRFSLGIGYEYILERISYDLGLSYIETNEKSPSEIASQYAKQISNIAPLVMVIDDFHHCLNNNGFFSDSRVKEFFVTLLKCLDQYENIKTIFSSNRRVRDLAQVSSNTIEVSKLDNDTIRSIISYCYKKITKRTTAPKIAEEIIQAAYGNPLAAILIAQLIVQKDGTEIQLNGQEFKRYQEGLIKNIIEEIEFTSDEKEFLEIIAVSKGEVYSDFMEKYYPHLSYCLESLSSRLIIEKSQGKLRLHPLFSEVFYTDMDVSVRFGVHEKYVKYFEGMNSSSPSRQDPSVLANLIYHLGGSLQIQKLNRYKSRYIDELKPNADRLYKDKNYKNALQYYIMIYDALGDVRYDILLRIAICYILDTDNVSLVKSKEFFEMAAKKNSRGAFIWADYSIALSNNRNYIDLSIEYAKEAEHICERYNNDLPWEKAKIKFAFAKAYRYQNVEKAKDYCKQACELDMSNTYYICTYIDMLIRCKQFEMAQEYIEKAEILQPRDKYLCRLKDKMKENADENQGESEIIPDVDFLEDDYEI